MTGSTTLGSRKVRDAGTWRSTYSFANVPGTANSLKRRKTKRRASRATKLVRVVDPRCDSDQNIVRRAQAEILANQIVGSVQEPDTSNISGRDSRKAESIPGLK